MKVGFAEDLFFTTVRIETTYSDEEGIGTGFFYFEKRSDDRQQLFLVTNKHVIVGAETARIFLTASDGTSPVVGRIHPLRIQDFARRCLVHPTADVALLPVGEEIAALVRAEGPVFLRNLAREVIPTEEQL